MEALSNSLQPYKELVGQVASYVTIAQFFSGAVVCYDVYKKRTTKGVSATPFIGGVAIGILMLKYGLLLNDAAMITVNVAGIFLNALYLAFFHFYAEDKQEELYKPMGIAVGLVAVLLGYAEMEHPDNLLFRFGFVLTLLMFALLGAPLLDVKNIIAKQDASSIPFPITFMGAIVTFLWFLYGIILMNEFMIVQNVVGFILCAVQLVLVFKYPGGQGGQGAQGQNPPP